jgi:hypothetical protein
MTDAADWWSAETVWEKALGPDSSWVTQRESEKH